MDVDSLERRAIAFCLASRLTTWPDDESTQAARALAEGLSDGDVDERNLAALSAELDGRAMEQEYISLFENGANRCPIHETEYGRMRGMSKGNELADIAGFYEAFGMARSDDPGARQMGDHLAVELEFYGTLLARQAALAEKRDDEGVFVVQDARRKFLIDHLGRLTRAIAGQPAVAASRAYGPVLSATRALVDDECRRLAAEPAPLDFFPSAAEPEAMCCGGSVSPGAKG